MGKYKEIISFCFLFSLSFVFMSQVIKTVNPIVSTFVTYGIAALFFILLNIKHISVLLLFTKNNFFSILNINISTLINTLLAFYVMVYVTPIVYIIVFFSGLSFFSIFLGKKQRKKFIKLLTLITFLVSIGTSFLITTSNLIHSLIGITLTLISTYFAFKYMEETAKLHNQKGMSTSQVLALRFFLVLIVCGGYSLYTSSLVKLTWEELSLLSAITVFGSIIPLFLMQVAIKKLGVSTTASFTPFTPILCMIFISLFQGVIFSSLQISATFAMAILLFIQNFQENREF